MVRLEGGQGELRGAYDMTKAWPWRHVHPPKPPLLGPPPKWTLPDPPPTPLADPRPAQGGGEHGGWKKIRACLQSWRVGKPL